MSRQPSAPHFHKSKTLNDKYLLGDEVGKGAYGRVYKGLDLENGDFVAIKQVSLDNIPPEDLASIMQEIDLLKNLNHQNIVKYQGSLKTKSHLYIILEYVENGSLANMIKPNKFGALRESVVAVYIAQVLEGLVYLHEQGVIHRDIKGANILITKEGMVKLADFGVATKLTEADVNTHSVVGTPYWMAPEVIEMSGVSAASDIWSVGCTVIELLTCVPPYYDLQPMPALFRIVQDDHPPLPDSIVSPAVTDFLHQCFRKDAKLRPDARTLLTHPWIRNTKRFVPNALQRAGGQLTKSQDVSTGSEKAIEDGEREERTPPVEEASIARDPFESGSDDDQKNASSSRTVDPSAAANNQSNSFGRRARIKIPRSIASMQRSPPSLLQQFAALSVDKAPASNSSPATDGTSLAPRSSTSAPGSPRLPGFTERLMSDLASHTADEVDSFDYKDNKNGRAQTVSHEATASVSPYSGGKVEEANGILEGSNHGSKQKALQLGKSLLNCSHHSLQRFEKKGDGREYLAKQAVEITRLVVLLKPNESEEAVISACEQLVGIFQEYPEQKTHLISQHGMIPLVEMLEVNNNRVLYSVMQLLNQVIKDNADFQENACLVGLIPIVMNFASPDRSREMRFQAALFVQQICLTSTLTLQMFIACRGLPVLVNFLEPDYSKCREMIHVAIDAMWQVFELQNTATRNDICRIFTTSGVLVRLVNTLYSLNEATRAASGVGIGGAFGSSSSSDPSRVLHRSHSGPLEQPRSTPVESRKPRSCQLDPARVCAGYAEPHRQVTGLIESHRPNSPQSHKSAGLPDYVRTLDQGRGSRVSAEPSSRTGSNLEGGHEIPWQSPARSLLSTAERDSSGHLDSPSRKDTEPSTPSLGNVDSSRPFSNHSSQNARVANGFTDHGQHEVQPLLSLLEKELPSRTWQPDHHRSIHSGGSDRPESLLPLLHHSAASRKVNGTLDAPGAGYTGGQSSSMVSSVQSQSHGVGSLSTYGDIPSSSSKNVSHRDSGHLPAASTSNFRIGDGSVPGIVSRRVSQLNAEVSRDYVAKVADLLLEFSRADTVVKSQMCRMNLLVRLFQMLGRLEPLILLKILNAIKELSTDPFTLEFLQRADAMKHLVIFLDIREGPYVTQIHNQVLNALYNLCKINKRRQEQAAECGIIPRLIFFINEDSPLKQYALPLLCDMAHASRYTREQLRANKGLEVYLSLLNDEYWAVTALDSLAVCLAHDNDQRKVEQALMKKDALQKLVTFFQSCSGPSFVHILEPFLKIMTKSIPLNTELAVSGLTPLLVGRLDHQDAIARLNLLKLIKAVYEHHPRPKQLIVEHDLPLKLHKLIEERRDGERSGGQVLVKQMATSLLKALHINTVL